MEIWMTPEELRRLFRRMISEIKRFFKVEL